MTKEEIILEGLLTLLQMVDRLVAAHATSKAEADAHAAAVEDLRSKLTNPALTKTSVTYSGDGSMSPEQLAALGRGEVVNLTVGNPQSV